MGIDDIAREQLASHCPLSDQPAVDVNMVCELSQETPGGPFQAALIREETRRWDDDPKPDIVETIVCETELQAAEVDVFAAVNDWLRTVHRLQVPPTSWEPGDTGPGTGVVMLVQGRAAPVRAASAA
jgi:hypothetical protein